MSIELDIQRWGISEVLHFTTNRGIVGVLATKELLSRHRLPTTDYLQYVLHNNAAIRPEAATYFDKSQNWLDFVNLSISEVNKRFLSVSQRWHERADVWWGILAFDPVIMTHPKVVFATTNNGYDLCRRAPGYAGFSALFSPTIDRKPQPSGIGIWRALRGLRAANLPTCEQAEILYPERVPVAYLRRIYVKVPEQRDLVRGWLREFGIGGVEVLVAPEKFVGKPN